MNPDLERLVARLRAGESLPVGHLSAGERCYLALASGRYELLAAGYDPIEAWHRLDSDWRRRVCRWRGWPLDQADGGARD